jgi:hypothetical protein
MVTIVGKAMIARSMDQFNAFNPLWMPNNWANPGPINTIPRNPIATEGIAASISIIGLRISCKFLGANSDKNAAVKIPNGTAITIEPKATKKVLTINGSMLYDFSGSQSQPVKKSRGEICKKNETLFEMSIKNIPANNEMVRNPVPLKINFDHRSICSLCLVFMVGCLQDNNRIFE